MPTPRFSVVTPVYEPPADVLAAMIKSVRKQRFTDWELCLVNDCSPSPYVAEMLAEAAASDPRIRVQTRAENGGIVAASNDALAMAEGEFVALVDNDDTIHPDAFELIDEALRASPDADFLYTDEDKIDRRGFHLGPFFKPDWSPERIRTQMYTCHLAMMRRTLVEEVGGFDAEFEGSQDWDLVLKVSERARQILHIPRVLYHWRMLETSAAGGGVEAKPWAFEAGKRAVQAHCDRIGLQARVERDEADAGVYHLNPVLREKPPVSIVIPTGGQHREIRWEPVVLVSHCVRSIVADSTYDDYEVIVVIDSHVEDSVRRELKEAAGDRLKLVEFDRKFSFSAKINVGAIHAEGKHLLLLNDDMEVITPDWIERMVMYSEMEEIGGVGGRLITGDGRLQHVGVEFSHGLPGHPYRGFPGDYGGYANAVKVARNLLAVTGACLMTRKELFDEVGGLSTGLPVNYNDMDFCLKLRALGKRIVYDPDLLMYHFESSSRDTGVGDWEKRRLLGRWAPMTMVDPYSNPNLSTGIPRITSHLDWVRRRRPKLRRRRQIA